MVNILERLPVHGHLQPQPLGLHVRVGHRPGHGLPRLQPGPARLRAHGPRARSAADPRHQRHPAASRRRLPPVPAADQARQRRGRQRLQRRPGLAGAGRGGLPARDRRHVDPRRAGALRQRARHRGAAVRAPACAPSSTPWTAWAHTGSRSSAAPTGTTVSTSTASARRPASPSRPPQNKEGGVAESVFIAALFTLAVPGDARDRRRCGADEVFIRRCEQARDEMVAAVDEHGWDGAWFRRAYDFFGNESSAPRRTRKARSSSSRRACAIMAGIGTDDGRAETQRSPRSASASPPSTASCSSTRPSAATTSSCGEISSYPPGYKENAGIFCHTNPWMMIAEAAVGQRRRGARLLPADQSVGPRGDLRGPPLRAVRLRPDDRRAGRAHPRRGQELVAHRHGRLELRGRRRRASSASARARGPAGRSVAPDRLGRLQRHPPLRGTTYRITVEKAAGTTRSCDGPRGGRHSGLGQPHPAARGGGRHRRGQGPHRGATRGATGP